MRNLASLVVVLCGTWVGAQAVAHADEPSAPSLAGSYDVKFEQISTNCEQPVSYPLHGSLKITEGKGEIRVDIDRTPLMIGKSPKPNKVSAKSPKPGHTPIEGMDGVFSVAGRITNEGMLSLVMVGEYQAAGKPLCTQSWNLSGLRARADRTEKPKK